MMEVMSSGRVAFEVNSVFIKLLKLAMVTMKCSSVLHTRRWYFLSSGSGPGKIALGSTCQRESTPYKEPKRSACLDDPVNSRSAGE